VSRSALTVDELARQGLHELTDIEILEQFAELFAEAACAFRTDPRYVVDMAEAAARLRIPRAQRTKRSRDVKPILRA
jgi:hypothetical protein